MFAPATWTADREVPTDAETLEHLLPLKELARPLRNSWGSPPSTPRGDLFTKTPVGSTMRELGVPAAPLGRVKRHKGLMGALQSRNPELVCQELIKNPHVTRIDWRFEPGAEPPCIKAVRSRCSADIHRLLLSRDADPNEEDDYGTTALGTFSAARSWTSTPFEQELNLGTWDKDSLPSSVQPADVDHVFAFLRNASVDQLLVDENQPWSTTGATFGFSTAMQNLAELTAEDRQQELPPSSLQPADDDPWESSPSGAKPQMTAEDRQQELEVASLLLAAGANPFHESSPGRTPVTVAKADGMKELAVLLEYYGDVQALRAIGFAANRPAHIDQLFALNGIADMVFSFLVPDKVVPRILHK